MYTCKNLTKKRLACTPRVAAAERSSDLTKLTKCPNSNFLFSLLSFVYSVCACVCMRVHFFYHTNSTLHRNPMCSNKALCGKTEINIRKTEKLHRAKNSINARRIRFKAKKTEQSTLWTGRGAALNQAKVWRKTFKRQYRHRFIIWDKSRDDERNIWAGEYLGSNRQINGLVCCSGLINWALMVVTVWFFLQKPVYRVTKKKKKACVFHNGMGALQIHCS